MIKLVNEAIAKWHVERLSTMIVRMRHWLKRGDGTDPALIKQHLGQAEEHFNDAISALKFNKYQQAMYACQRGLSQIGMAQLLTTYGDDLNQIVAKANTIERSTRKKPEEQELIGYLASSLAEMKMSIEYSNFHVSDRAQTLLNSSMDFYNDCLSALKQAENEAAKRKAQAGLLQLSLAGRIISAENDMSLPGWRGLNNPVLGAPLRRVDELLEQIVTCRTAMKRLTANKGSAARLRYDKALKHYNEAISSFSMGSNAHAQSLIRSATEEIEEAINAANGASLEGDEGNSNDADDEELQREPLADVPSIIASVASLVETLPLSKKEVALKRMHTVTQLYKDAIRATKKERFVEAEKLAADSLMELDLLRHFMLSQSERSTAEHEKY
ncbi:MAG: hypothetical protein K2W95_07870 [Candidatus Obscuribacterales bacterium]|nr:hypothetical protein [Candidatus Obscuribacterales bacterium]